MWIAWQLKECRIDLRSWTSQLEVKKKCRYFSGKPQEKHFRRPVSLCSFTVSTFVPVVVIIMTSINVEYKPLLMESKRNLSCVWLFFLSAYEIQPYFCLSKDSVMMSFLLLTSFPLYTYMTNASIGMLDIFSYYE